MIIPGKIGFTSNGMDILDLMPARIEMFFDLTHCDISNTDIAEHDNDTPDVDRPFDHTYLEETIYAVVWSAKSLTFPDEKITDFHLPMNLGYRVELEGYRRIIPVTSFRKPCFGMLNMCGLPGTFDNTAFILKDRTEWADFFLSGPE
jgi:hypothetical protein